MWFIRRWNVAGALHSPKGITFHSNNPHGVIKAVFSLSFSSIPTCQYPLVRSSEVNHWALLLIFLTLQRCKVTVLHLLDRELHGLKLTRDYVTTLTNYKGWFTTTKIS